MRKSILQEVRSPTSERLVHDANLTAQQSECFLYVPDRVCGAHDASCHAQANSSIPAAPLTIPMRQRVCRLRIEVIERLGQARTRPEATSAREDEFPPAPETNPPTEDAHTHARARKMVHSIAARCANQNMYLLHEFADGTSRYPRFTLTSRSFSQNSPPEQPHPSPYDSHRLRHTSSRQAEPDSRRSAKVEDRGKVAISWRTQPRPRLPGEQPHTPPQQLSTTHPTSLHYTTNASDAA